MLYQPCWVNISEEYCLVNTKLSKYVWDNIAQENYLHNIGPECTAMILKEKNLHNSVLVCLDQDCTKQ